MVKYRECPLWDKGATRGGRIGLAGLHVARGAGSEVARTRRQSVVLCCVCLFPEK